MPKPHIARAAASLALLPLTACGLRGEVTVEPDVLSIDLVVTVPREESDKSEGPCTPGWLGSEVALKVKPVLLADGSNEVACHLQGELAHSAVAPWAWLVASSSEGVVFVQVPAGGVLPTVSGADKLAHVDVTVHFPGQVVSTNGALNAFGTSVRVTDAQALWAHGFSATARTEAGVAGWVLPAFAGLGWGAILTGVVGSLWSWSGAPAPQDAASSRPEAGSELAQPHAPAGHTTPTDGALDV